MNVKADTIIRTVVLIVALVNQILVGIGKPVLPIDNAQIEEVLTLTFTIAASLWAWWKNNSFTKKAIAADEMLTELREVSKD